MAEDLRGWPDDLILIFTAINKVMAGRQLNPEMLARLPIGKDAIVPGHTVEITHRTAAELGERRGRYTIELRGARWVDGGRWSFVSGQLERLARGAGGLN